MLIEDSRSHPVAPEELRAQRVALGLTQSELGVLLGLPPTTIARWECGSLRIGSPTLLRLALERVSEAAVTPEQGPAASAVYSLGPDARALDVDLLTRRERDVAALLARGLTNAQIAQELVISVRTVDTHVAHIRSKLQASSRTGVAVWVAQRGLLQASKIRSIADYD
jgi:DNA-binding CsgD family transcriptional regulator/DNA-binding XRE family transcriptional regulator